MLCTLYADHRSYWNVTETDICVPWLISVYTKLWIQFNWAFMGCTTNTIFLTQRPGDAYMRQQSNHHGFRYGLSPGWHKAIIWTNAGILLIRTLRTKSSEILIEIHTSSFKEMHLKTSSAKWRPFWLGLNVLKNVAIEKDEINEDYLA